MALTASASWFPGHMATFMRQLPALLAQTHVVLEVRDIRLPLTSINPVLEDALDKWKKSRASSASAAPCERIVVYTKRDLIGGGEEDLKYALSKHFDHRTHFNSNGVPRDLRTLHSALVSIAQEHKETVPSLSVLVVGMPNMGKSTLLNSLRWAGTSNAASIIIATKAMRTSAQPGLTQKTSERLKLNKDPPIYAVDSPGVMVPYLGSGEEGRERAMKLALIAGIKESLYDDETLATFLLSHLNRLNPESPAYLALYPSKAGQTPTDSIEQFLGLLADRLGARSKGGGIDVQRTSKWFLKWWREGGAKSAPMTHGWGFDFDFRLSDEERVSEASSTEHQSTVIEAGSLKEKMERRVGTYKRDVLDADDVSSRGFGKSPTKEKQLALSQRKVEREIKWSALRGARS